MCVLYKVARLSNLRLEWLTLVLFLVAGPVFGADTEVAALPPMGWNSYDTYGDSVTEREIMANARYMSERLRAYGWEYIVVDYRWYDPGARSGDLNHDRLGAALTADSFGRLLPAPNRFPSAAGAGGFGGLAARVHALGLKFGIHVMRGIPRQSVKANTPIEGSRFHAADAGRTGDTCAWCPDMYGVDGASAAGQDWYNSIFRLYASWGVDLVKVDDLSRPYHRAEIEAIRRAIDASGRPMVFSTSPGETPVVEAAHIRQYANMWRISDDFWDSWPLLNRQFDLLARWQGKGGPGHWPDADMIPLGHISKRCRAGGEERWTRLTYDEQVTLMSLWAINSSPLMLGMNLPDNDGRTLALISNDEVLSVDQDPLGNPAQCIVRAGGGEIWTKRLESGALAVAMFNRSGVARDLTLYFTRVGIQLGRCSTTSGIARFWPRPRIISRPPSRRMVPF